MQSPRFGLGFRIAYAEAISRAPRSVDWLELVSDHFLGVGGPRHALLEELRREHALALHGVGLDIAGSDPLDAAYLDGLRALVLRCDPLYVSDHLCWTAFAGQQSHDLLPVAYTSEVLAHVAERVSRVQDRIGRVLLLENATAYVAFRASEMDEAEFLAALCRTTGCGILLDVNNLFVNAMNLGADPAHALAVLPDAAVGYLHLAGHAVLPDVRIDTHAESVPAAVWELFGAVAQRFPRADVILERDGDLPPYPQLVSELEEARKRHAEAVSTAPSRRAVSAEGTRFPVPPGRDWAGLQCSFWHSAIAADEGVPPVDLGSLLDPDRPVSAERGVRVYRESYFAQLSAALATHFPSLTRVLGDEDWRRLATDYLRAHPPRGHGFVGFGVALSAFLCDYRFSTDHGVPACVFAELARLEQAQLEAQDALESEGTVSLSDLAGIDPATWERARIVFAPSVRLVRATHDVAGVVAAAGRGSRPERPPAAERVYLVARNGTRVETIALAAGVAALVELLIEGRSFSDACAVASAAAGIDAVDAAEQGARWLVDACARGWVAAVEAIP
jgi:uncharacterized protein (UPF0276 family)